MFKNFGYFCKIIKDCQNKKSHLANKLLIKISPKPCLCLRTLSAPLHHTNQLLDRVANIMSYDNKAKCFVLLSCLVVLTERFFCSCPKYEERKRNFLFRLFLMEFLHIVQLHGTLFENEINSQ